MGKNDVIGEGIATPHDHDVLCGRGGAAFKHVGNYTFRYLVQLNKPIYVTCKKSQKRTISKNIVTAIKNQKPPGRFLELNTKENLWYEISETRTIEKTSQALREGQATILKKMQKNEEAEKKEESSPPAITSIPSMPKQEVDLSVSPSSAILQQQQEAMHDHNSAHVVSLNESDLHYQQEQSLQQSAVTVQQSNVQQPTMQQSPVQQSYMQPMTVPSNYTQQGPTYVPAATQSNAAYTPNNVQSYNYNDYQYQQYQQEYTQQYQPYSSNEYKSNVPSSKRDSIGSMFSSMEGEDLDLPTNLSEVWDENVEDDGALRFSDKKIFPENCTINIPIIDETTMLRARRLSSYLTRSGNSSNTPNSFGAVPNKMAKTEVNEPQCLDLTTEEEENIIRACSLLNPGTNSTKTTPSYSILPLKDCGKTASADFGMKGSAVSILSEFSSMSVTSNDNPRTGSVRFSQLSLMDTDDIDDFMDHYNKGASQQYPTDNPRLNYIYNVLNQSNQNISDDQMGVGRDSFTSSASGSNKRNGIVFPEFIQGDVAKLVEQG